MTNSLQIGDRVRFINRDKKMDCLFGIPGTVVTIGAEVGVEVKLDKVPVQWGHDSVWCSSREVRKAE